MPDRILQVEFLPRTIRVNGIDFHRLSIQSDRLINLALPFPHVAEFDHRKGILRIARQPLERLLLLNLQSYRIF